MLGVGVILSFAVFLTLRGWERRDLERQAGSLARAQVERLHADMLRSMEVLHSIASFYEARGRISREEFHDFVQSALARQPEIQALSWNPLVPDAQRSKVEGQAAAEGLSGFAFSQLTPFGDLVRAERRSQYVPVLFIEPGRGNGAALGYDLNSDACRRAALAQARAAGDAVATEPIKLAQGPQAQPGFLVLLPVYSQPKSPPARVEGTRDPAGFAVAVFRIRELLSNAFEGLARQGIEVSVFDESRPEAPVFSTVTGAGAGRAADSSQAIGLEVANRRWTVGWFLKPAFSAAQAQPQSWLVLAGGLAFTGLTTAYLCLAWRQTKRVARANAALEQEVGVRQRAEAQAGAANRAKSDFLASMSHEIRTPLNAMLGYAQLLQRDAGLSPEQRDGLGSIHSSGQHLLGLINEILDLSKIEAGRMELHPADFDLTALGRSLAAIFRPLCAAKRIEFRLAIEAPERTWVRGDEGKLRQVLINLLGNAVKFTQVGEVYLHLERAADERWLFEVIDTGLGIPEDEQADIFEPFHQGANAQHQGGTGLGLAIAQRQVALLGGTLGLQSERGIGSRFHFAVPLAAGQPMASPAVASVRVLGLEAGCRVRALVIDDHKESREVLGRMLFQVGCEVSLAASGREGLDRAREFQPQNRLCGPADARDGRHHGSGALASGPLLRVAQESSPRRPRFWHDIKKRLGRSAARGSFPSLFKRSSSTSACGLSSASDLRPPDP